MSAVLTFGPFRFDTETGRLRSGRQDVPLPPRAQALLERLLERPGRLITKDELLDGVWQGVHVTETSLKEAVHVLRQSLGDDPRSPVYVETVPRRGYRFLASVAREEPSAPTPDRLPSLAQIPRWRLVWWLGGMVLGLSLAAILLSQRRPAGPGPPGVPHRFEIRLPAGHAMTPGPPNLALSPDGRLLAYAAKSGGQRRLFLRPVGRLGSVALAGTEGASAPFFSPDGRWVGFFTDSALKRVAVSGGGAETLCGVDRGLSASWGPQGIVMSLFGSRDRAGLWQVPSEGGRPRVLTTLGEGEGAHLWPEVLPGGGAVVFTVKRTTPGDAQTVVRDLASGERTALVAGSNARYAPPGYLVFAREDRLWSAPFDPRRRQAIGAEVHIPEEVAMTPVFGTAHFAVAPSGSLVFMPRTEAPAPVLVRRRGDEELERSPLALKASVGDLRLSPDGRRLAIAAAAGKGGLDLWVLELERRSLARLTFDGASLGPVWSPDGEWLLAASTSGGSTSLVRLRADGGGEAETLWTDDVHVVATSWSSIARHVAFSRLAPESGWDLWILRVGEPVEAESWLSTPFDESRAVFSPDGRFLAYESDETGRQEVYVRPFSSPGAQWPISTEGGSHPIWSSGGREIWYRRGEQVFSVEVSFEPEVEIGRPEPRFETAGLPGYSMAFSSSAAGIDEALYLEASAEPSAPTALTFLVNGLDGLD